MKKLMKFLVIPLLLSILISLSVRDRSRLTVEVLSLNQYDSYTIDIDTEEDYEELLWSSSNTGVASVDERTGKVTAMGEGTANIFCTAVTEDGDSQTFQCVVHVQSPFFSNDYMAHSGGGFKGTIYNNTEEAIRNSIENGFRFIEMDVTLTSDNQTVCWHGWDKDTYEATGIEYSGVPTYEEFMTWQVQGRYNTLDAADLIAIMEEYPELLVEIDLKDATAEETRIMMQQLTKLADYDPQVLDRILMQFANEGAFHAIEEVYEFKYYQYFTYKSRVAEELDSIIQFCLEQGVCSVAINYTVLDEAMAAKVKDAGLYLLSFTTDEQEVADDLLEMGVDTICTNFLTP